MGKKTLSESEPSLKSGYLVSAKEVELHGKAPGRDADSAKSSCGEPL